MKLSVFQVFFLAIFVLLAIVGVIFFAASGRIGSSGGVGKVSIWGTVDQETIESTLVALRQQDKSFGDVTYTQMNSDTYINKLINAMASGSGPDLILLPQNYVISLRDKLSVIPYSAISQQTFVSSYIDEGQLFLSTEGILALPLIEDPMVMYWNRDLFNSAAIAQPPRYWDDFIDIAPHLTVLDANSNVKKSAVALGEWSNIRYAKDIVSMLFLQAGDPIVTKDTDGAIRAALGTVNQGNTENPATSALQFYTEFANPTKTIYSWNRSLPDSQDAFVSGDLAAYFGYASDYKTIIDRNPNIHFGVSLVPQLKGSSVRLTYGNMLGLAIPRTASNTAGALTVAQKMTSQIGIAALAANSTFPPVRRDVTVDTSANAAASTFVQAALMARAWLDPDPIQTRGIYATMIQSVVSGKADVSKAVTDAGLALQMLLQ